MSFAAESFKHQYGNVNGVCGSANSVQGKARHQYGSVNGDQLFDAGPKGWETMLKKEGMFDFQSP